VTRVVVIPVSGYINRLQAIASAALLAEDIGAELAICWIPDAVAPVPAERVLAESLYSGRLIDAGGLRAMTGVDPREVPRYLHRQADTVSLAGHDRGEQVFMAELASMLDVQRPEQLLIRAGGRYFLPLRGATETSFRQRRHAFYRAPILATAIEVEAHQQAARHHPYIGLHLRYTDRAHQAPTSRAITRALHDVVERTGTRAVFIASDTAAARTSWVERLQRQGLAPWTAAHDSWDRSVAGSEFAAMVDWRLLTRAAGLVYFAESSFAVEAAVASAGHEHSVGLAPSPWRSAAVRGSTLVRAAVTYPRRHGWPGA